MEIIEQLLKMMKEQDYDMDDVAFIGIEFLTGDRLCYDRKKGKDQYGFTIKEYREREKTTGEKFMGK